MLHYKEIWKLPRETSLTEEMDWREGGDDRERKGGKEKEDREGREKKRRRGIEEGIYREERKWRKKARGRRQEIQDSNIS